MSKEHPCEGWDLTRMLYPEWAMVAAAMRRALAREAGRQGLRECPDCMAMAPSMACPLWDLDCPLASRDASRDAPPGQGDGEDGAPIDLWAGCGGG